MSKDTDEKTSGDKKRKPLRRPSFRQRFDDAEHQREHLIRRLESMRQSAVAHPGYRRVRTLLNATFRKSSLAQRVAILQAASWLIDILENVTSIM